MATLHPTPQAQYLLELINRARANPLDEVNRNGAVNDLNQGLAANTLSTQAKQPLAFNLNLNSAARSHSQWMLDTDTFSHTGANGSNAGQRMAAAGYEFTGAYFWGENLSWQGTTGNLNLEESLALQHDGLFESPGHRTNLMEDSFKEIGLGIAVGEFNGYNAATVTQNFARSGPASYLTGVIYTDAVVDDNFYTVGEALSGITIEAVRQADGLVFTTTNYASGGYSLPLDPGVYTITFEGDSLVQPVSQAITIGDTNVKLDLATDLLTPAPTAVAVLADRGGTPPPIPPQSLPTGGALATSPAEAPDGLGQPLAAPDLTEQLSPLYPVGLYQVDLGGV